MPKNTFLLIAILAVFAALVIGVNIGKKFNPSVETDQQVSSVVPLASATPTPALSQFTGCGITFAYPKSLTKLDIETGGAMLVNSTDPNLSIAVACQKDIPRPALLDDKIEALKIGSVSAKLYHDASEKDGATIDKLFMKHPKTGQDVYVSGFGDIYNSVLSTIALQ